MPAALIGLLLIVACGCRWLSIQRSGGYWLDEIFSASYVGLGFFDNIVSVMRYDVHPPLYYLHLNLWGTLAGATDHALLLNSLFWSLAAMLFGLRYLWRHHGPSAAVVFAGLMAVLGSDWYYVAELRMYTMMGALALLGLALAEPYRERGDWASGWKLGLALITLGAVHSAALVAVSAVLLYAAPFADGRIDRTRLRSWLLLCTAVGTTMLPWVINASLRNVGHIGKPSLPSLLEILGSFLVGPFSEVPITTKHGLGVLVLALIVTSLVRPATRRLTACLVVWPFVFTALVSILYKPMWYYREYAFVAGLFALLVAINAAAVLTRLADRRIARQAFAAVGVAGLAALGAYNWTTVDRPNQSTFVEVSRYLDAHVEAGDLVYIPDNRSFWGIARYLIGPDWGNLLDIQDPVDQDRSKIWPKVYAKLGPEWLERLHLAGRTRRLDDWRATLFIGWSPLPELRDVEAYWYVITNNATGDNEPPYPVHCVSDDDARVRLSGFDVLRVRCPTGVP